MTKRGSDLTGRSFIRRFIDAYIDVRMATAGALVLGSIVFAINVDHGVLPALTAALKQGAYTFLFGGLIAKYGEKLSVTDQNPWLAVPVATVVPCAIAILGTYGVHSLKGTPEPFNSTIPIMLMTPGSFCGLAIFYRRREHERLAKAPRTQFLHPFPNSGLVWALMEHNWRWEGKSLRHTVLGWAWMAYLFGLALLGSFLRLLDRIFYSGLTEVKVERPVYIFSSPRSGSSYFSHLMALDQQFETMRLYHTYLPSVLFYRFFKHLGRLDRAVGRPIQRFVLAPLNHVMFKTCEDMHKTGWDLPEEDELIWYYVNLAASMIIFFPFAHELENRIHVDRMEEKERRRASAYIREVVQRFLYATDPQKTYLAKNAVAGWRLERYLEAFPDMRVIQTYRHPYDSLASALSMFARKPWGIHSPGVAGRSEDMRWAAEYWCHQELLLLELRKKLPSDRYVAVAYDDLLANPVGTIRKVYDHLGLELSEQYEGDLIRETNKAKAYRSRHQYRLEDFGIEREWVYHQLKAVFQHYGFER